MTLAATPTTSRSVDVAILGAGTAGLNALRAAQREGARAVIIDPGPLGTTCARVGCMPSKLLIAAADHAHDARAARDFGLCIDDISVEGEAVLARLQRLRDHFVGHTLAGWRALWGPDGADDDNPDFLRGRARFLSPTTLAVDAPSGAPLATVTARATVIATGSRPYVPPPYRDLGDRLLTNESVFELDRLPESLLVVGAGPIGLELGQAFHRLGVRVTLLDLGDRVAQITDPVVADAARAHFAAELEAYFDHELLALDPHPDHVAVRFRTSGGLVRSERFERVLVATGRRPHWADLDLEAAGLSALPAIDPLTARLGDTSIYVAGDVTGDRLIQHEAAHEGQLAGANAARHPHPQPAPRKTPLAIVFSDPQVAQVGADFASLDPEATAIGRFDMANLGRAKVHGRARGLIRVYADRDSRRLLGGTLLSPAAEHLAHSLAWAIQLGATVDSALDLPFYHPAYEEGLGSALKDLGRALGRRPTPQRQPTPA